MYSATPDLAEVTDLFGNWVDEPGDFGCEDGVIGCEDGVSCDRFRWMEVEVAAALSAWLGGPAEAFHTPARVARLQAQLEAACPVVAPWEEVARAVPELAAPIPGTGMCPGDLAGLLFPGLHRDGPWIAWRPVARLRAQTVQLAVGSVPAGRRAAVLAAYRQVLGLDGRHWDGWLDHCGLRRFRGQVVRSGASVADLAEAVLAEEGHPMTTAEIAAQVPVQRWKARDCLGRDDRFCRTGPGVYGLAEWGLPAYRGIRAHIIEQIARSGRPGQAGCRRRRAGQPVRRQQE